MHGIDNSLRNKTLGSEILGRNSRDFWLYGIDTASVLHELRVMRRNVTITLDEATARWARVEAARQDTSLSDFLASLLRERMTQEQEYARAMEAYLAVTPKKLKRSGSYPKRGSVHDRGLLR